jgi:hypothetical protein
MWLRRTIQQGKALAVVVFVSCTAVRGIEAQSDPDSARSVLGKLTRDHACLTPPIRVTRTIGTLTPRERCALVVAALEAMRRRVGQKDSTGSGLGSTDTLGIKGAIVGEWHLEEVGGSGQFVPGHSSTYWTVEFNQPSHPSHVGVQFRSDGQVFVGVMRREF